MTVSVPRLWPEPFGRLRGILLPFSALHAAIQQQQQRRRAVSAAAPFTTIYVSKAGDDANTGLSSGTAVLTIARGNLRALTTASITRILVEGVGTWHETVAPSRNGLRFEADGGAIIDGDATRAGVNLGSKDDCAIAGFEITNTLAESYAITGSGADRALIEDVLIHDCPRGVFLNNCDDATIRLSTIRDVSFRHGIELRSCANPLVEDVEGERCVGRVLYGYGSTGGTARRVYAHDGYGGSDYGFEFEAFAGAGANDWDVIDCWAGTTTGNRLKYGFISKTSARTRFQRCVAWDCGNSAGGAGFYFKGSADSQMYHCDSYGNVGFATNNGIYLGYDDVSGGLSTDIAIRNSIISGNATGINAQNGSTFASDDNDLHGNTTLAKIGGTSYDQAAWQAAGDDVNSLFVDPLYATTVYGGFVPGAASVLIGGGDLGEGAGVPMGHTGSEWDG